jgi:hypothetical protein
LRSLLQKGGSIEIVSKLLGHSSIRVTERHYAPRIKARQERLETAIRRIWTVDGAPAWEPCGLAKIDHGARAR